MFSYTSFEIRSRKHTSASTDSYLPTIHRPLRVGFDMPALIPLDTTYGVMLIGAVFGIW